MVKFSNVLLGLEDQRFTLIGDNSHKSKKQAKSSVSKFPETNPTGPTTTIPPIGPSSPSHPPDGHSPVDNLQNSPSASSSPELNLTAFDGHNSPTGETSQPTVTPSRGSLIGQENQAQEGHSPVDNLQNSPSTSSSPERNLTSFDGHKSPTGETSQPTVTPSTGSLIGQENQSHTRSEAQEGHSPVDNLQNSPSTLSSPERNLTAFDGHKSPTGETSQPTVTPSTGSLIGQENQSHTRSEAQEGHSPVDNLQNSPSTLSSPERNLTAFDGHKSPTGETSQPTVTPSTGSLIGQENQSHTRSEAQEGHSPVDNLQNSPSTLSSPERNLTAFDGHNSPTGETSQPTVTPSRGSLIGQENQAQEGHSPVDNLQNSPSTSSSPERNLTAFDGHNSPTGETSQPTVTDSGQNSLGDNQNNPSSQRVIVDPVDPQLVQPEANAGERSNGDNQPSRGRNKRKRGGQRRPTGGNKRRKTGQVRGESSMTLETTNTRNDLTRQINNMKHEIEGMRKRLLNEGGGGGGILRAAYSLALTHEILMEMPSFMFQMPRNTLYSRALRYLVRNFNIDATAEDLEPRCAAVTNELNLSNIRLIFTNQTCYIHNVWDPAEANGNGDFPDFFADVHALKNDQNVLEETRNRL
ncbi:hypothetical protein CASFOL_042375 [Castilleja foliolosa]|uniref:Uncharacterized protein n=1 Tax=Castilleja foliolosa TaxID=1961234 RepID=A0ABD3BA89_9LAMI